MQSPTRCSTHQVQGADGVGDYNDSFSPVPGTSGFRTIFSLVNQLDMFTDHFDISQAFVQGELLPGDGHNQNVYTSSPPGFKLILLAFITGNSSLETLLEGLCGQIYIDLS